MNRSNTAASAGSKVDATSDFLQLRTADAPQGGLAAWLCAQLREAMADGRLPVGAQLPPTRVLAADLRVSRGVVTEAYQRLREEGNVAGRGRSGTVVVAVPVSAPASPALGAASPALGAASPALPSRESHATDARVGRSGRASSTFPSARDAGVFDALRAAEARVDFTPGVPDLGAFPRAAWLRAERAVLSRAPASAFGYGDPRGAPELRAAVAAWVARYRGIRVDPSRVLVVSGVAQALWLLAQVLVDEGVEAVAVEDPSSLGARQHLHRWGLTTPPVAVDEDGVRVAELSATGASAVLLTPAHQFPTGVVLAGERRRELMSWASGGGLVIEDDYDAEHRYDRAPVPALQSMLPEHVCYAGSISKLLAPALRLGWVIAPPRYFDALVDAKRYADLGSAGLPQLSLAELMSSGELERQLRFLRGRHRRRRDAMVDAITAELPGAVVHGAAAGLHLMVTFDDSFSDVDLAAAALARGVKAHPLSWHRQRPGPPGLVLGYAARTPTAIADGIATIARARHDLR